MKCNGFLWGTMSFGLLFQPWQEIEDASASKDTQPEYQLGSIDDHSQDVNSGPEH